ncbi:hypothetical protein BpHYR1_045475 [Brachionus plicatilis]|uniref:Uncharacterized protein n=1 Tax=Brachionus plicatilis TaxID=10195 RepID=A0A3M7Q0A2_BRAPC|nr:hypothetical protein BpHYR1_045475 [Brachionus plicatilis]
MRKGNLFFSASEQYLFQITTNTIKEITIRASNSCHVDLPIYIKNADNKSLPMFLSNNNFIKSFSQEIHCSLVNDRIILPSHKFSIIFNISNVIVKQIYIDHYNLSTLNFNHHKEIINDFSTLRKQNKLDNNDINGNFYVLPNDDINLTNSAFSKLINSKNILYEEIDKIKYYLNIALTIIVETLYCSKL